MPAGIAPTPSDAPVGQQKKGSASSVAVIPFARSSKWHIEQGNTQTGIAINSAQPGTLNFPIPSYGYLSAVLITVAATGGTGTAAVAFEDAPWSLLSSIQLQDVNGVPIVQLSGYSAYLAAKYGGYRVFPLDGSSNQNVYQPVQTSGNFKFILPIFLEFGRDGLGCLPNMDASARYNLQIVLASGLASATGPVYTTAPTGYPTVSITVEALFRSQPPATDMFGNQNSVTPPAVGTVQYWTSQTASGLANGANTIQLTRVGNLIRNHVLVFRNTNGTRATAETAGDVPLSLEMDWDVGVRYLANVATLRQLFGYQTYGYDVPNGVVVLPNTTDPDRLAVSEYGDEWLPTVGATKLTLRFTTTTGNGSLAIVTNDIVPASGQIYSASGLSIG